MKKILDYLLHPSYFLYKLDTLGIIRLSDYQFLSILCKKIFGKDFNIYNPLTFNEKLQWLKLNDRKEIYTTMVDKFEVKKYASSIIGEEYIIPTLGIYDNFDDIDFDSLPDQFVIKCTHDSGGVIICKDKSKLNIKESKKIINKSLKANFYYAGREWPYKNVKPRIIIEKYLDDKTNTNIKDYKFFCFNGVPKYCLICSERNTNLKETFYDINWKPAGFKIPNHECDYSIQKPNGFFKMRELASVLSKNIPFIRVDFYEVNNKILFGELTFYPAGGFEKFEPEEWDKKLGDLIKLPIDKK